MGWRAEADGKSEGRFAMKRIEVEPPGDITSRESGQTSRDGVSLRESLTNRLRKQSR
jgi:hypothetical protein